MSAVATERNFFVRFPRLDAEQASILAKATDFERCAGLAVRAGKPSEAEHLRSQARAAWKRYLEGEKKSF